MSASANLPHTYDLVSIAKAAGSLGAYRYEIDTFIVSDVTQTALDAAIAAYNDVAYQAQRQAMAAFASAIASGCRVVSTANPSLNDTYAIDPTSLATITSIATGIAARSRVPGGGATFVYPQMSSHQFSATDFLNLASALEDYVYNLSNGLPVTQPVTIS